MSNIPKLPPIKGAVKVDENSAVDVGVPEGAS